MASISSSREGQSQVSLESLQLTIDEETKAYINDFEDMDSSQVMTYRWPTETPGSPSEDDSDEWIPMEYPPIPSSKNPAIQSVAGSRKFNVVPFESDGFTSAVNAQRAGAGAPGLCGLGLTRDKSKFSSTLLSPQNQEGTSLGHQNSETNMEEDIHKNSLAGMMFKAAGAQILSGSLKEEEGWRNIYRSCLPAGSADPFEFEPRGGGQCATLSGVVLCDKVCQCDETEAANEAITASISHSPAIKTLRDQPPLQDALVAINDGLLSANEWIHFCEAVRDIVKWNDFTAL